MKDLENYNKYLVDNLLPLIEEIDPKQVDSLVFECLGLETDKSTQSLVIQFGNKIEDFWNIVLSHCSRTENLIEGKGNDRINVNGKSRQIDHFFKTVDDGDKNYLESKCNLDFDSEKSKASNAKVQELAIILKADLSGYFCPVARNIDNSVSIKYRNKGLKVYSVNDMIEILGDECPFTIEEYFSFLKFAGSLLKDKHGIR